MSVAFVFDPVAWELPLARWTVETVATLLEMRWRTMRLGERLGDDEAPVFVGPIANAPAAMAQVLACDLWPRWEPESLRLADVDGVPVPCPGGVAAPWTDRVLPAEWLRSLGFQLAREEEFLDDRRDEWGCFKGTWSRMHELGVLDAPLVNLCAAQLESRIRAWHAARGREPERIPRWPDGARFAVALTHDVDDVALWSMAGAARRLACARSLGSFAVRDGLRAAARSAAASLRRMAGDRSPDPYDNFYQWTSAEEQHGFRSSWYFVPLYSSRRHELDPTYGWNDPVSFDGRRTTVAGMMERLDARGYEIGLHGSYLSHGDAAELARQRRSVEGASRSPISGGRQHFLRFDVRRTWSAQRAAGLTYDSTLGYNEAVGFRSGIAAPFRPWNPETRSAHDLLELPLTLMDGTLFRSLGLDGPGAAARTRSHLERVAACGGLAVLLWHPNAAAERQFPGWWHAYVETLQWLAASGAWVAPAAAVASFWTERDAKARVPGGR